MNMSKMKLYVIILSFYLFQTVLSIDVQERSKSRDARKLFGGYRITPRFCKPTRETSKELRGPNICMFNHECIQRNGLVVGACMDGFLFGACCQLPAGTAGELMDNDDKPAFSPDNNLHARPYTKTPNMAGQITSSGVSQIASTLLHGSMLPTAQDNIIVQINEQQQFATAGVTHPTAPDTYVVNQYNDINPDDFKPSSEPIMEDRKTTFRVEDTTHPYVPDVSPFIHISISNAPPYYTPSPIFQKPIFRPKPHKPSDADKYVLVPTINHNIKNKTEIESIVDIIQMLNESSTHSYNGGQGYTIMTTRKPPSTSYVFSATTTKRPGYETNNDKTKITSRKPPSSYTYATSAPTRKTTTKIKSSKRPTKPTKTTIKRPISSTYSTSKKPVYQYISSSTFRPGQTTYGGAYSSYYTTKRPPSTSYVYSTSTSSKRPATLSNTQGGYTTNTQGGYTTNSQGGYTVTKYPSQYSTYSSPPTILVLGSLGPTEYSTTSKPPSKYAYTTDVGNSSKRPVAVTINNHVTQNIYSSTDRPSPTILITPKPSASAAFDEDTIEVGTSANDLINFPPVRNPNLNMSNPIFDENDITTPEFIDDDALNTKVESFVNKIIEGLQEPFEGLKDVVYNKNKTAFLETTTKKPTKKQGTKKPTSRPSSLTTSGRPTSKRPTNSKRPTTTSVTTKKPVTTSRRTKPTKRVTTTPQNFIEEDDGSTDPSSDYRSQCGIRPLMKSGRIVGGKGATFGEFPWQVLVRESTWLGLFTKNKCGGVLISNRYVMTAAHCQPGFLASLVAVFGEFDISGDLETKRSISRNVKRVIVHRQYDAATFENDLALLELEHPVLFDAHIVPICLPRDHEDFTSRMATVTGWGRLKYGGGVPSVLQEVQVPIMENSVCQEMFRTAGHSKVILESFLCAGYANGQKDSCEGDSGGPLVLQRPDGRYQLAGTVSHGIKCAAPYLPGVYMRTTYYKPWIESITNVH